MLPYRVYVVIFSNSCVYRNLRRTMFGVQGLVRSATIFRRLFAVNSGCRDFRSGWRRYSQYSCAVALVVIYALLFSIRCYGTEFFRVRAIEQKTSLRPMSFIKNVKIANSPYCHDLAYPLAVFREFTPGNVLIRMVFHESSNLGRCHIWRWKNFILSHSRHSSESGVASLIGKVNWFILQNELDSDFDRQLEGWSISPVPYALVNIYGVLPRIFDGTDISGTWKIDQNVSSLRLNCSLALINRGDGCGVSVRFARPDLVESIPRYFGAHAGTISGPLSGVGLAPNLDVGGVCSAPLKICESGIYCGGSERSACPPREPSLLRKIFCVASFLCSLFFYALIISFVQKRDCRGYSFLLIFLGLGAISYTFGLILQLQAH
jgi:hypothetical protein